MIGALVSILSLNLTLSLVQPPVGSPQVAGSFTISGATTTTPIVVTTTAPHNVPLGRVVHGVLAGVVGTTEANGLWIFTPTGTQTFSLSTFTAGGKLAQSVGVNAYVSGGTISYAFPDYEILLGRRWIARATAPASPRVVMVPTFEAAWGFDPYGGIGVALNGVPVTGNPEIDAATLQPQGETEPLTFEVYVTGCANPPSPDFGDFDATQAIVWALRTVMHDGAGLPRCKVLRASWVSQLPANHPMASGVDTSRGQQWMGIIEFQQPVTTFPLQYVPPNTSLVYDITTVQGGSSDDTILVVT